MRTQEIAHFVFRTGPVRAMFDVELSRLPYISIQASRASPSGRRTARATADCR